MRHYVVGIACVLAVLAWSVPAFAADEKAGHGTPGKHAPVKYKAHVHGDDGKEKEVKYDLSDKAQRDQLIADIEHGHVGELSQDKPPDLFGIKRWDLGLWSLAIFVILFLILSKVAWKPMLEGLHKREEKIRSALELAEQTRREAMAQNEQLQAKLKESAGQVATMMDEARKDAQALKDQLVADAKTEIQAERNRLYHEIETAKDQAMQEIWQQSVTLATSMSAKAMRKSIGEADHQRLLDESLAELKEAGKGFPKRQLTGGAL